MSLASATAVNSQANITPINQASDTTGNNQAALTNQTPQTTPRSGGVTHQAQKFTPPPRVIPRSPRSLRDFSVGSPPQQRGRSESSPASLASPAKAMPPATPVATATLSPQTTPLSIATTAPQPKPSATLLATPSTTPLSTLPPLALSVLTGDNLSDVSPPPSPTRLMRLRVSKRISSSLKSMGVEKGSASAPTTPRKSSASSTDKLPTSTLHGIKSPNKLRGSEIQAQPSPRKLDQELITLSKEIAGHWIRAIQGDGVGSKGMRKSGATAFLGQAVKIPVDQFSSELRKRLPASFKESTITHSALIGTLYGNAFDTSPAAKILLNARRSVMQDYGDAKLTLAELESRTESDPEAKKRYKQNMEDRTLDCANFLFGTGASQSPDGVFSEELVALWQAMDSQLVALNYGKPERERLAYELVLSRMVLKAAKGDEAEAGLAVPTLFLGTVKEVSAKMFPAFREQVLKQFDSKRAAPSNTAAPSSTAATDLSGLSNSSASSTGTASSNNQPQ